MEKQAEPGATFNPNDGLMHYKNGTSYQAKSTVPR